MDGQLKSVLVGGAIALAGVFLGAVITEWFARLRERRAKDTEKRLLAGALAAEIRGLLERWKEILPREAPGTVPMFVGWAAEQSYFTVYDGAGHRIYLFPAKITAQVVRWYINAKAVLDTLGVARSLHERFLLGNPPQPVVQVTAPLQQASLEYSRKALEFGQLLAAEAEHLIPVLERIATTGR